MLPRLMLFALLFTGCSKDSNSESAEVSGQSTTKGENTKKPAATDCVLYGPKAMPADWSWPKGYELSEPIVRDTEITAYRKSRDKPSPNDVLEAFTPTLEEAGWKVIGTTKEGERKHKFIRFNFFATKGNTLASVQLHSIDNVAGSSVTISFSDWGGPASDLFFEDSSLGATVVRYGFDNHLISYVVSLTEASEVGRKKARDAIANQLEKRGFELERGESPALRVAKYKDTEKLPMEFSANGWWKRAGLTQLNAHVNVTEAGAVIEMSGGSCGYDGPDAPTLKKR